MNATVTEYLTAVILFAAYQNQRQQRRRRALPVRVSVPINMRAFYPTPTLRNFSTFVNPGIDPRLGDYAFEDIVAEVRAFMRYQVNPRLLSATIATNVADERNLLIRLVPLALKNLVISSIFRQSGDKLVTATLSNLGVAKMPEGMEKWVRRFEFQLGVPSSPLWNCACVTTGDEVRLVFSAAIRETDMPRETLRFLAEQGVPVEVESNLED